MAISDEAWTSVYNAARSEIDALPTLELTHDYYIPPRPGYTNIHLSPGWGGDIVALWVLDAVEANAHDEASSGALFPRTTLSEAIPAIVSIHSRDGARDVHLDRLELDHCSVQPMPDGQILVAGARCRYSPDTGAEHNAAVYDDAGKLVRTGTFGDGIKHLRCTEHGDVWVGYFDEGVLGNYGWGGGDGPEPIGASGLVRFDVSLQKVWECRLASLGWSQITDCYALEVDGADVWICYYTDFDIARVRGGEISVWTNEAVRGVRSLVVSGDYVGLIGGYLGEHDRIVIGRLADYRFQVEAEARMALPGGAELLNLYIVGSDGEITVAMPDGHVYRASFDDWLDQL
jgi:hypothetical protein